MGCHDYLLTQRLSAGDAIVSSSLWHMLAEAEPESPGQAQDLGPLVSSALTSINHLSLPLCNEFLLCMEPGSWEEKLLRMFTPSSGSKDDSMLALTLLWETQCSDISQGLKF